MSADEILFTLFVVFILGAIVVLANLADRRRDRSLRNMLLLTLAGINVLVVVLYGVMQLAMAYSPDSDDINPPSENEAVAAMIGSLLLAGLGTAALIEPVRARMTVFMPRRDQPAPLPQPEIDSQLVLDPEKAIELPLPDAVAPTHMVGVINTSKEAEPLFPQMFDYYTDSSVLVPRRIEFHGSAPTIIESVRRGFDSGSMVHLVALVFCLHMLGVQFINFILGGGLEGIAEQYEEEGLSALDLLINGLPLLLIPVLGVGLGVRRNLPQTLKRLGLEVPTVQGLGAVVGVTFGLFVFVILVGSLWMGLVSEETYEEQNEASSALSDSVTTIGLAFLLAATAAVTEEIAFRGALQPIFGFWPTALLFALTHAQYTLTPAWFIIFGVAVGFGWLRRRFNTTTSMLAHFLYNFIPLALSTVVPEEEALLWITRLF